MKNAYKLISLLVLSLAVSLISNQLETPVHAQTNSQIAAIKEAASKPANQNALNKGNVPSCGLKDIKAREWSLPS